MRIRTARSTQNGTAKRRRTPTQTVRRVRDVTEENWEARLYTFWARVGRITKGVDFGDRTDRRDRIRSLTGSIMMAGMPESAVVEVLRSLPEWTPWKLGAVVRSCRRRIDLAGPAEIAIPDWPDGRIMQRLHTRHRNRKARQQRAQQRAEASGSRRMAEQRPDWESRPIPPGAIRFAAEGE